MKNNWFNKIITAILSLCAVESYGQMNSEFYGPRFNVSLMHSRVSGKNAVKESGTNFTSINMFDFTLGGPEVRKSYFDFSVRVVSDGWWMIGKELKGKTDYLNDGYLGSVFEMKWGMNAISKNKFVLTPGLESNSYWAVFAGHREFAWCIGPFIKADYLLSEKWMTRTIAGWDLPFTRSSGSMESKSKYLYARAEIFNQRGLMVGVDYANGNIKGSSNAALPESKLRRLDFRLGWKIKM